MGQNQTRTDTGFEIIKKDIKTIIIVFCVFKT